jgi:LysM repeat protein
MATVILTFLPRFNNGLRLLSGRLVVAGVVGVAALGVSGCGESDGVYTTLPPIRSTTTSSTTTTTTVAQEIQTYVVQPGETLSVIAERFGVSVAAIVDLNEISNPDRIDAGVTIKIPVRTQVP